MPSGEEGREREVEILVRRHQLKVLSRKAGRAAYAAGLATGFWSGLDELRANYTITRRWQADMDPDERARGIAAWRSGVDRTLGLTEADRD